MCIYIYSHTHMYIQAYPKFLVLQSAYLKEWGLGSLCWDEGNSFGDFGGPGSGMVCT